MPVAMPGRRKAEDQLDDLDANMGRHSGDLFRRRRVDVMNMVFVPVDEGAAGTYRVPDNTGSVWENGVDTSRS